MSEDERMVERRLRDRQLEILGGEEEDEEIDERRFLDAEECKSKLPEWINEEETLKYIKNKFTRFLSQFKSDK